MYVLSISSVSEVLMVHTQKNLPTKNILQTKKEMETFIFLFKKKISKVNKPKKSISSTSRQLLNLPLFVCLSLSSQLSTSTYYSLSLLLLLPLSLSVSLCSCFTHNLCNICSYIISLFKSKKIKQSLRWNFISFHSWFSSFFLEQSKLQDYKCIYSHYTIYTYI